MKFLLFLSILLTQAFTPAQGAEPARTPAAEAASMFQKGDYLGLRVFLRKTLTAPTYAAHPLKPAQWAYLRRLAVNEAHLVGYDMIYLLDSRNPVQSDLEKQIGEADAALLSKNFDAAFTRYQNVATQLKAMRSRPSDAAFANALYPYILQYMGRALFGAKRYADALTVYDWIPADFPRYRQVMFEKMWSAFRLGRVDIALGAIASQKSVYLSRALDPESCLVMGYVFKKLCRTNDIKYVLGEIEHLEADYEANRMKSWADADPETRAFWKLAWSHSREPSSLVSNPEREAERMRLSQTLKTSFARHRETMLKNLKTMKAYLSLADIGDTHTALKPVTQFRDRSELLKMGLEIWPIDSTEEWADEVGKHLFLGESQCAKIAASQP